MLHLGLKTLSYKVRFDNTCSYPVSFVNGKNTKLLFGITYGWLRNSSVSVAWRPKEESVGKIALFAHTYMNGVESMDYAGTIETDKTYFVKIKRERKHDIYWLEVFEEGIKNKAINFSTYFKYPFLKIGYTLRRTHGYKILMERN